MEIWPTAYKHGINDDQIHHAVRNAIRYVEDDESDVIMLIGPASPDGELIEVGRVTTFDGAPVIHAMHARPKYLRR